MLTQKITNYLTGGIRIKISGSTPERFINLCMAQGILLWGIIKRDNDLYAWISLPDFFRIRSVAQKSCSRVRVVSFYGAPFQVKRVKKRKMLLVGAALFLILLNVLSSYIWFVDVTGYKQIPGERIRQVVYDNGLRPGVLKDHADVKMIENSILVSLPEVAWVGITFTGTRAVVEVVEKTLPKQEDKAPANIVAEKDGVITELIALAGQPVVKVGDTVKKGDLLIKGVVPEAVPNSAETPPVPPVPAVPQLIRAKGIVKARVWYDGYGEASQVQELRQRTGNREIAVVLKIGKKEIMLKDVTQHPFALYETEVIHKNLPGWRNREFPVESTINIYYELTSSVQEITPEQAQDEAKARALGAVQAHIPEAAQIVSRNIEVLKAAESNLVRVKASIESIEDIGQSVVINQ